MDKLTTKAAARLLAGMPWTNDRERESWERLISAIEDEARDQNVTLRIAAIEAKARADLAARIEARLRVEPTPPRLYALSAWDLDCVLAAIHEEAERA